MPSTGPGGAGLDEGLCQHLRPCGPGEGRRADPGAAWRQRATVPSESLGKRTHAAIAGSGRLVLEDAPHGCNSRDASEFNGALLDFRAGDPSRGRAKLPPAGMRVLCTAGIMRACAHPALPLGRSPIPRARNRGRCHRCRKKPHVSAPRSMVAATRTWSTISGRPSCRGKSDQAAASLHHDVVLTLHSRPWQGRSA